MLTCFCLLLQNQGLHHHPQQDQLWHKGAAGKPPYILHNVELICLFQTLYMKLFFVLGILWVVESIHSIIHNKQEKCELSSMEVEVFFRVIDMLNILRGFLIFLIFICKRTVWTKMTRVYKQKSSQSARARLDKQKQVYKNICCQSFSKHPDTPGDHELHNPVQPEQQAD